VPGGQRTKRARGRRLAAITASILVLTALALGFSEARSHTTATGRPLGPAATDGRERVLFVGDSLTFGAKDQLTATFADHGVAAHFVGFPGTGLLSGRGFWLRGISDQVRTFHPDVVVIEACCNYANGEPEWVDARGHSVAPDSAEMFQLWTQHAREAVRRAEAGGATVRWVITPQAGPLVDAEVRARVERFEQIASGLGVERVDWRSAVEPDGHFTSTAVVDGARVAIRKEDDLHMTDAGSALVAAETWRTVAPAFDQPANR
jgi:hypothetical protein